MNIIYVIYVIIAVAFIATAIYAWWSYTKNVEGISFKEALDLTELPIITFQNNGKKFNFLLDTGSNLNHINKRCIDSNTITFTETDLNANVFGMEGNVVNSNIVLIDLVLRGQTYSADFMVTDLGQAFDAVKEENGVTLHGILGTSFFDKYKYIIDFNKYVAYSKK